jgi:hypothetical protein
LGSFSVNALKTERSWLLIPGLGLFLRILTILNYLLRIRDNASELRIICPPPSCKHPSISTISSIFYYTINKRINFNKFAFLAKLMKLVIKHHSSVLFSICSWTAVSFSKILFLGVNFRQSTPGIIYSWLTVDHLTDWFILPRKIL